MTQALRVLFLNDTARNGGPGRSLHTILSFLDPAEVHRTVLLPREDVIADLLRTSRCAEDIVIEPDLIENPFQPRDRAVERDDLDAPWRVRGPRLALNVGRLGRLAVTLPRLVRERGIDVIYCNGTTADFVGAAVALRTASPPSGTSVTRRCPTRRRPSTAGSRRAPRWPASCVSRARRRRSSRTARRRSR